MKKNEEEFNFIVEPLLKKHDRAAFSCEVEPLDKYFKTQARQDVDKKAAATFVLVDQGASRVAGFYTLAATAVPLRDLPDLIAKKLPRYPLVPATLLGPLGLPLGALVLLRALGLPAVALSRLLVFRAGGPATLVFRARGPATRQALG